MSAVSPVLLQTIKQLQSLPSLSQFALAGGTNLAFRFNHRYSQDIDLFCPEIVGVKHFEKIEQEVIDYFGKQNIIGLEYPIDKQSEQHTYIRFWISTKNEKIKVEIIQNMKMVDEVEIIDGVRLVTTKDIGLFKLISGSFRAARKDIYDLDFITEQIKIVELFEMLKAKKGTFNKKAHQNIFDLDEDECPTQNPKLLLKFDGGVKQNKQKPMHSHDNILIVKGGKGWASAKTSWRMKVRRLFTHLEIEFK